MMSLWDVRFKDHADPRHSTCHVVGSQFMVATIISSHFQVLICSWGYLRPWVKISNGQKSCNTIFQKSLPLVSRFRIANDWFSLTGTTLGRNRAQQPLPAQHPGGILKCRVFPPQVWLCTEWPPSYSNLFSQAGFPNSLYAPMSYFDFSTFLAPSG